jgi:hypothetical protein
LAAGGQALRQDRHRIGVRLGEESRQPERDRIGSQAIVDGIDRLLRKIAR